VKLQNKQKKQNRDFSEITKQTEKNKIGILVKLQNKQKKNKIWLSK
jgi:hypothetical protein